MALLVFIPIAFPEFKSDGICCMGFSLMAFAEFQHDGTCWVSTRLHCWVSVVRFHKALCKKTSVYVYLCSVRITNVAIPDWICMFGKFWIVCEGERAGSPREMGDRCRPSNRLHSIWCPFRKKKGAILYRQTALLLALRRLWAIVSCPNIFKGTVSRAGLGFWRHKWIDLGQNKRRVWFLMSHSNFQSH